MLTYTLGKTCAKESIKRQPCPCASLHCFHFPSVFILWVCTVCLRKALHYQWICVKLRYLLFILHRWDIDQKDCCLFVINIISSSNLSICNLHWNKNKIKELTKKVYVSQHTCLLLKARLHSKAYIPSLPWCLEDSIWKCVTKGAMHKSDTLLLPSYFLCLSHGWNNAMQRMGNYIYVLISLKQCIVRDVGTCWAIHTIIIQNYKYKCKRRRFKKRRMRQMSQLKL